MFGSAYPSAIAHWLNSLWGPGPYSWNCPSLPPFPRCCWGSLASVRYETTGNISVHHLLKWVVEWVAEWVVRPRAGSWGAHACTHTHTCIHTRTHTHAHETAANMLVAHARKRVRLVASPINSKER